MSAHTVTTIKGVLNGNGRMKQVTFDMTGSASYDAGGSILDLSTGGVLGVEAGFTSVHGVHCVQSTAANSKYQFRYTRVAAATGTLKVNDASQAADAEASGDLSASTFTMVAWGY